MIFRNFYDIPKSPLNKNDNEEEVSERPGSGLKTYDVLGC